MTGEPTVVFKIIFFVIGGVTGCGFVYMIYLRVKARWLEKMIEATGWGDAADDRIIRCSPVEFCRLIRESHPELVNLDKLGEYQLLLHYFWPTLEDGKKRKSLSKVDGASVLKLLKKAGLGYENKSLEEIIDGLYGIELFSLKLKLMISQECAQGAFYTPLIYRYSTLLEGQADKHAEDKYKARIDERNQVISELSHHIKNLSASVSEPLESLRHRQGVPENIVENALRGARLIHNIVNAMNLSVSGSRKDFVFDATHLDDHPVSLASIIWSALEFAVPNMFDGKHFSKFLHNYFPTKEAFVVAREAWAEASVSGDPKRFVACLEEHFFDLSVEMNGDFELMLGDTKGSATKMLILCQELLMNAVKYASTIERKNRKVHLLLEQNQVNITLSVENSCSSESQMKTAGVGHTVIKNFAGLLGCKPKITKTLGWYSVALNFNNFNQTKQEKCS